MLENLVQLEVWAQVKDSLVMRLIYHSDADIDWKKMTRYPIIALMETENDGIVLTPTEPMMEMFCAPRPEQRGEGRLYQIPLKGDEQFTAEVLGNGISNTVNRI